MNHPRSGFAASPQGGDPSGRAEPVCGVCSERVIHVARVARREVEPLG